MDDGVCDGLRDDAHRILLDDLEPQRAKLDAACQFFDDGLASVGNLPEEWAANGDWRAYKIRIWVSGNLKSSIVEDAHGRLARQHARGLLGEQQHGGARGAQYSLLIPSGQANVKHGFVDTASEPALTCVGLPVVGFQQLEIDLFKPRLCRYDSSRMAKIADFGGRQFLVSSGQANEGPVIDDTVNPLALLNL